LMERVAEGRVRGRLVSRDIKFDREIPTPSLIASSHRYSMGWFVSW
jgi:hypothetical protein